MKRKPDEAGDCYHSRYLDSIDEEVEGRHAKPKALNPGAGDQYPMPPSDYPLAAQPDHGFDSSRDRVGSNDATPMTFGVDLATLSGAPPKDEEK